MAPLRSRGSIQPYPREKDSLLAEASLFPVQKPKLSKSVIRAAILEAFSRLKKTKKGDLSKVAATPAELVQVCLTHLKERSDPILGPLFYGALEIEEIFEMDAVSHEMQRQRMKIGIFYQYLLLELMRAAMSSGKSNILRAFDGGRAGDVVADIKTPGFNKNLRLYISVKKSSDTVGGQDFGGMIQSLENVARSDKNLTSPYLCVVAIATPQKGRILDYQQSRSVRYNQDKRPYSENCEVWAPGFLYPYITGWSPKEIYEESVSIAEQELPFYSIKFRKECAALLKDEFKKIGIIDSTGNKVSKEHFFDYTLREHNN